MSLKFEPPENNIIFKETKPPKKKKAKKFIINISVLVIIGVSGFFGYKSLIKWYDNKQEIEKSKEIYEAINDFVFVTEPETSKPEETSQSNNETVSNQAETTAPLPVYQKVSFDRLKKINPDAYGWIEISGFNISYPVAKANDNTYYISTAFNGEPSINGSVFRDFRCDEESDLTILYGHRSVDGSMFFPLDALDTEYNNNQVIISKEDGVYIYDIWAVAHVPYDGDAYRVNFSNSWTLQNYIDYIKRYAKNTTNHINELNEESELLMLSTCVTSSANPWRRVICTKLSDFIPNNAE